MQNLQNITSDPLALEHELTKGFAAKLIRHKARSLVGCLGLTRSDREDLEQEMKWALLKRLKSFDSNRGHWNVFVTLVVENHIARILEYREADKREFSYDLVSLSLLTPDADGETLPLSHLIAEEDLGRRTGRDVRCHEDEADQRLDWEALLERLPPDLREACQVRLEHNLQDSACLLRIPRARLYQLLEWTRDWAKARNFFF